MTTNADFTFTPHPSPEEIQGRWNVPLRHLRDEGENHAIATRLRSIWRDNWWKYPDDIKRSFLSATFKTAITKSNAKGPSAHALYKASISWSNQDFDWGVWLVLRVIYYDVHLDPTHQKARLKCLNFRHGHACKLIRQRYPDVDVLKEDVPPTFPPRPHGWTSLDGRGTGGSRRSKMYILASTANHSTGNQAPTGESDGTDSDDETTDESDGSPPPDNATRKEKKEARAHTLAPDRDGGSPSHENLDLPPSSLDAATSIAPNDSTQHVNSSTSNSGQTPSDGKNKVALEQGPVNESDHREKATDTSNNSNLRSDESNNVPRSLPKRSMSDDEEEDSPCGGIHTQKRHCTSSDQSHSPESEATSNSGIQMAISGENLDRIHELLKKHLNERVAEYVSQQVARQAENLQPRLKEQMAQFLPEKIFGTIESSELSSIAQQVIDSMAEQVASKITRQVIQQLTQQLTRELTSELQPEADKQIADCIAQIMLEKLFGSTGNFGF